MKITLSLFLIFCLSTAFGGDRNTAYNLICKPMTFESERRDCIEKIKNFRYFDDRALNICKGQIFDSNKLDCLEIIGDKYYEDYEMDYCINQTFESKKVECLKESGTINFPEKICVPREETIKQLNNSIYEMRSGNLAAADQRLNRLLNRFVNCR